VNQNITFSADQQLIEAARRRATEESTTLNEQFRLWLAGYAADPHRVLQFDAAMKTLQGHLTVGPKVTRDSANSR
jgi:hypothetical protein